MSVLYTLFACASVASAHMLMNTPAPYSSPALHNGPLQADGSDFPCQLTSGTSLVAGSASNSFALGSEQALKFTGQAVHGGGSCQISITYDSAPSASSTWKVIRSIEGGCPAQGESGNMGDDASAADPYTYNFTVPDNIPSGDVTLAWTWFNKIGNREMYMNCAPVTLTGTGGSQSNFDSLPDMFTANIGDECATVDSTDLLFPNPGQDVIQMNGATSAFSAPTGTGCQAAGASAAAGSGSGSYSGSGSGAGSSSSSVVAAATTTAAAASADSNTIAGGVFVTIATSAAATAASADSNTIAGGVFVTIATSAAAAAATEAGSAATTTAAAAATTAPAAAATTTAAAAAATTPAAAAAASPASSSSGATGTAQTAGSACSVEGEWNCLGSSYQQCASGVWSVVMQMAAGTVCGVGESNTLNIAVSKNKRVALRFRA